MSRNRFWHNDCDRCRGQIERELDRRDRVDAARKATGQRNKARALERHEHVEREWLAAEAATRGSLLNPRGRALDISERSLFTGSEDRAMRYASRELLNYWQEHSRPTAASMSGSYRVRREAQARSNLGRQQAGPRERAIRTSSGGQFTCQPEGGVGVSHLTTGKWSDGSLRVTVAFGR